MVRENFKDRFLDLAPAKIYKCHIFLLDIYPWSHRAGIKSGSYHILPLQWPIIKSTKILSAGQVCKRCVGPSHSSLDHMRRSRVSHCSLTHYYDHTCNNLETIRLDLTVGNHAFLVEPQWNPMVEEQALSLVHRIGQTKVVNLVRFIVKNIWEEKTVTAQECKRILADMIVKGSRLKSGDDGRK